MVVMMIFFRSGTTIEDFRQGGTMAWDRDWLKICAFSQHTSRDVIGSCSFLRVHCPQCAPHLMLLRCQDVAAVAQWMYCGFL